MHQEKIESSKLQIGEAIRILEGAIETIREAQRWPGGQGQPVNAEQDKTGKEQQR